MGLSMLDIQRDIILDTVRNTGRGQWKVLVVDQNSRKIIDNVVKEDDILSEKITYITEIEKRRDADPGMDVIYILSPEAHIIDCLMSDFERDRYGRSYLVWTSLLPPPLRQRIDQSRTAQQKIASFSVINVEFYPRESHLVTFRDPWSFPVLFHPGANKMVKQHLEAMASKIVSVCVALGEYPVIRYYNPNAGHEAGVLSSLLAEFVEGEIDMYAQYHQDFPPPSNRPRSTLYITDRSMDVVGPLLHEFTYQAMAHDLLPIREGEKVTYKTIINEGRSDEEEKDMEIGESDKIWLENRHQHMKDTIDKLMSDFNRFIKENPDFTRQGDAKGANLNTIKDMMAGLPQFTEMKDAYSLHLSMAQECMNIFQARKLVEVALVEQTLSTGLDEDYRKPKSIADGLVRVLDDPSVSPSDRLRVIALYLLYKDGLIPADLEKLLAHAQLPPQDASALDNLDLLGVRVTRQLRDTRAPTPPAFPFKPPPPSAMEDDYQLARFAPAIKSLLEEHCAGTLSDSLFPSTKPELTASQDTMAQATSLRSAKPTWAKSRVTPSSSNQQRIIIFMAGGATFAEARACYEISRERNRDVVLITSHMQTPGLFLRQVAELSANLRQLRIPMDGPKPKAPAWISEKERPDVPPTSSGGGGGAGPAMGGGPAIGGGPKPTGAKTPMGGALPSGPRPQVASSGQPRSRQPRIGQGGAMGGTMSSMSQTMSSMRIDNTPSPSASGGNSVNGGASATGSSTNLVGKEKEKGDKKDKKRHHFFGGKEKK